MVEADPEAELVPDQPAHAIEVGRLDRAQVVAALAEEVLALPPRWGVEARAVSQVEMANEAEILVWVTQAAGLGAGATSGTISRLDPVDRRRVGAPASLPGPPAGVSVGEASVWVAIAGDGALVEVGR